MRSLGQRDAILEQQEQLLVGMDAARDEVNLEAPDIVLDVGGWKSVKLSGDGKEARGIDADRTDAIAGNRREIEPQRPAVPKR